MLAQGVRSDGDALHAVLCAVRFNIRWFMRAPLRQAEASGLKHVFLALKARYQGWAEGLIRRLDRSAEQNGTVWRQTKRADTLGWPLTPRHAN